MSHVDDEFSKNLLNQIMQLWVMPELERRRKSPEEINLRGAQIIFYPDGIKREIRINDEIRAIGKVKLKPGISKKKGEPVYENEIEGMDGMGLTEDDDPDCAHVTLVRSLNTWFISFDFRYNKAFSKRHLQIAKEFYELAKESYDKKYWSVFVDNLFSSAELIAKATLLSMPNREFRKKTSHKEIHSKYNTFASLGNVPPNFKNVFNKLSGWRDIGRYPKTNKPFKITEEEGLNLLETVKRMIEDCEKRLQIGEIHAKPSL